MPRISSMRISGLLFLGSLGLAACEQPARTPAAAAQVPPSTVIVPSEAPEPPATQLPGRAATALAFINGYVRAVNRGGNPLDSLAATPGLRDLSTGRFQQQLRQIVREARRPDGETSLDADPVLDAQDLPDAGFELAEADADSVYLTVRGVDWPDFRLTMKLAQENGRWLVDGCGRVNIPPARRARR